MLDLGEHQLVEIHWAGRGLWRALSLAREPGVRRPIPGDAAPLAGRRAASRSVHRLAPSQLRRWPARRPEDCEIHGSRPQPGVARARGLAQADRAGHSVWSRGARVRRLCPGLAMRSFKFVIDMSAAFRRTRSTGRMARPTTNQMSAATTRMRIGATKDNRADSELVSAVTPAIEIPSTRIGASPVPSCTSYSLSWPSFGESMVTKCPRDPVPATLTSGPLWSKFALEPRS